MCGLWGRLFKTLQNVRLYKLGLSLKSNRNVALRSLYPGQECLIAII